MHKEYVGEVVQDVMQHLMKKLCTLNAVQSSVN